MSWVLRKHFFDTFSQAETRRGCRHPDLSTSGLGKRDANNQSIPHKLGSHSGAVTSVVSGKGLCSSQIILSSSDCTVKFWSLLRGRIHLQTVVMSPSGSEFYTAGSDGSAHKGPAGPGAQRRMVRWARSHDGPVVSLGMANGGEKAWSQLQRMGAFEFRELTMGSLF